MATKNEVKKPILYKIIIGLLVIGILGALIFSIVTTFRLRTLSSPELPEMQMQTVEYRDASIDMNGDGILDYVISAEVIIVGEDQNLTEGQSPQE